MGLVVKVTNKFKAILLIVFASIFLNCVSATTYKSLTVDEIFEKSEIAFHAKVTAIEVESLDNAVGVSEPWASEPWTKVTFEVLELFKGDLVESHTLYFFGGVTDSHGIEVDAMPSFRNEEELLIFAYESRFYSPLVGFSQGLFRSDEEAWQNEQGQWLGIEEDSFFLSEESLGDSEAIITKLQTVFSVEGQDSSGEDGQ